MKRYDIIYQQLEKLTELGVVQDYLMVQSNMPGKRWHIIPKGFAERAYSTSEIEIFILGTHAAIAAGKMEGEVQVQYD
jgi:hypothetical protein